MPASAQKQHFPGLYYYSKTKPLLQGKNHLKCYQSCKAETGQKASFLPQSLSGFPFFVFQFDLELPFLHKMLFHAIIYKRKYLPHLFFIRIISVYPIIFTFLFRQCL